MAHKDTSGASVGDPKGMYVRDVERQVISWDAAYLRKVPTHNLKVEEVPILKDTRDQEVELETLDTEVKAGDTSVV